MSNLFVANRIDCEEYKDSSCIITRLDQLSLEKLRKGKVPHVDQGRGNSEFQQTSTLTFIFVFRIRGPESET